MRRIPRAKRIEESVGNGGLDLAGVEEFCRSARDNGADGSVIVGARITCRGLIRKLWVDIPKDVYRRSAASPDPSSVRVFGSDR